MKWIFNLVILLSTSFSLNAQHHISGSVISDNNHPIEFASVSISPLSDSTNIRGVITTKKGFFEFNDLLSADYQLTVQMLGYQDWTQVLKITKNVRLDEITLREEITLLGEVEVIAEQSILENRLGKKVLYIGQDLTSSGSNVLEALEIIPSISSTQKGEIQIRGSTNVIIYINGKETKRAPETLKFISAEALSKIELITNPSAKYDAEGVAGIINLVYKKDKAAQFKLEIITNLLMRTNPFYAKPNGGMNVSFNKDKFSVFANISFSSGKYKTHINSKRSNFQNDLRFYENYIVEKGTSTIGDFNVGVSIEPDSTLSMGLELNYDRWDISYNSTQTSFFDFKNMPLQKASLFNHATELENEFWVNYSLEKKIKPKQILKISLTAGGEDEKNNTQSEQLDILTLPIHLQQFLLSSDEVEKQRYYQGKADFETSFLKFGKIEAGVKADLIQYNIFQKVQLHSNTIMLPDNDYSMDMKKIGLYFLQSHQIKKLKYSLGLRLEQFSSEAIQYDNQKTFTQKYLRFFPSIQIHYLLPDHAHTLGFNYTRRINRPGFFDLNPFISYQDPLNLETGNPALRPEIANLFELNYHRSKDFWSIDLTGYKRVTTDVIQSNITAIENDQTLASTINIGKQVSQGVEGQLEYRLGKLLKTTGTIVLAQIKYLAPENEISYNNRMTWKARLKQQFRFANNWKIEFSETYRAPSYQFQQKRHEVYYMNFAINKKFNNNRGNLSLVVSDIFNTRSFDESLLTAEFEVVRNYKPQTRRIRLGLKYSIFDGKK